jgi:hypothetical protein
VATSTTGSEEIKCVDCGRSPPPTDTNYTLIGARHGWRLKRAESDGRTVMAWYCPSCWQAQRKRAGGS